MMQQPMGLQALMQRQRPAASQPGMGIPPGLQALLQAQQVLRSQASPVTMDGRPTIARQTEQAIAQQTAPQAGAMAPNPQMQPQNPGTVAQAAQSAGIAGQQQQAQQQQAMQAAMQMAQQQQGQQPQGMARGGVAALKADNLTSMKYAQGGVAGYNGETGSSVGIPIYKPDPASDVSADEQQKQIDALRNAKAVIQNKLYTYGLRQRAADPTGFAALQQLLNRTENELETASRIGEASRWKERQPLESQVPAAQVGLVTPSVRQMMAAPTTAPAPSPAPAAPAAAAAPRPAPAVASPRPTGPRPTATPAAAAPAPVPAANQGVAALMQMPVNPDLEKARAMRDALFTGTAPTPESIISERERFRKAQGLSGPVGSAIEESIRKAAERSAAMETEYGEGKKGRRLEQIISALSAGARGPVGSLGAQYVSGQQSAREADMKFRQLMDASAAQREQMAATVQTMREAAASNDVAAYQKASDEYRKLKNDHATTARQLAASTLQASAQMQEGALDRVARAAEGQANRETQLKVAQIQKAAAAMGTPEMRLAEWIKNPENLEAYKTLLSAKGEPGLIKQLTVEAVKNPAMLEILKNTNPQLYSQIMAEISSSGVTSSVPSGAKARP